MRYNSSVTPASLRASASRKHVLLAGPVLMAVLLGAMAAPATAAVPARLAAPAARVVSDDLNTDSCMPAAAGPAHFACLAVGSFVSGRTVQPLALTFKQGGAWHPERVPDAGSANQVNLPDEVSCVAVGLHGPTCVLVGQHYTNPRKAAQLAEVWRGAWKRIHLDSPHGTTWSALFDVSCPSETFCLLVGAAGTTRKSGSGFIVILHATAYTWNGTRVTKLSVPAPAGARTTELAGVSCPTTTTCTAVGNYITAADRESTYAAQWTGGHWQLQATRNALGAPVSTFEAVSCPSTTECMAVGQVNGRGGEFAELWSNGHWRLSLEPDGYKAGLFGVACPTLSSCYAAGDRSGRGLILHWQNSRWFPIKIGPTPAPFKFDVLGHVSCATADQCVAVGARYGRTAKSGGTTFRTLIVQLSNHHWQIKNSPNQ